ncbi:uncharacterized protein LOC144160077 [Haemaphysalis longicornis]
MAAVAGSCTSFYFGADISRWMSPMQVCVTLGCLELADKIAASMDMGTDPCDDFYLFSCGGRASAHPASNLDPQGDVVSKVHTLLADWALEGEAKTPLQESVSLYQGCVAIIRNRKRGVRHLIRFLEKCHINVAKEDIHEDPLDAILNLVVRYNIATLFEVAVERRLLLVRRRQDLYEWAAVRLSIIKNHAYSNYLEDTFAVLGFPSRVRISVTVASVWGTEDTIMRLLKRMKQDEGTLIYFNLTERGILDRPEWKAHLRFFWNHLAVKGPSVAAFVNRIFHDMTALTITQYVFWEVVRQLGPFADFRLHAPDETAADSEKRCFRAAYGVTGLAPLAFVMAQQVSSKSVQAAGTFLTRLLQNVGTENVTVKVVDPRYHFLTTTFSASLPITSSDVAEGSSGSFLPFYIRALLASRQREFDSLNSLDVVLTKEDMIARRVIFNGDEIVVPPSLLVQPWFSPDVPHSFNYAGLGFVVLKELIQSGFQPRPRHSQTASWMAQPPTALTSCNGTVSPSARALELLLQVLSHDHYEDIHQKMPGSLEHMTEQQLLFLALCTARCDLNVSTNGEECRDVLRSTWHFGKAYECLPGDYMNPRELSHCEDAPGKATLSFFAGALLKNITGKIRKMATDNVTFP